MSSEFIEFKTTEGQTVSFRKDAIAGFEVVPSSARVDGHIKVFVAGFKFLLSIEKEEFLKKISAK